MGNPPDNRNDIKAAGFKRYASKRIAIAVVLITVVVWAFSSIPESAGRGATKSEDNIAEKTHQATSKDTDNASVEEEAESTVSEGDHHQNEIPDSPATTDAETASPVLLPSDEESQPQQDEDADTEAHDAETEAPQADAPQPAVEEAEDHDETEPQTASETDQDLPAPHGETATPEQKDLPKGVVFTNATIRPLEYELNDRFWGWRPNDIINLTDNVNNFQLGVLEVTRRTVVLLAERISRTGTTDAFDPHLENAMNWLMVKSNQYWFPSPESKYKESIAEVKAYRDKLMNGRGSFYTRTDNIIPLLLSYEDLLGSCDENLVKQKNGDGSKISMFKADDYFYYAKGVADTMAIVLEAVHHDFLNTLESRHAAELLHHALESCRQAAALDPLWVTNGNLDGILANHRANMAAPISHARFYISQLIKTLST